jgi:hypothetical protein
VILGMSIPTFTLVHSVLSLIGILAGLVVVFGMFGSNRLPGATAVFLATTVLTCVTGFFFPRDQILPSHIVGIITLVVLGVAIVTLYVYRLAGAWRWIYVASAVLSLYLNVFVGLVQAFLKVPFLNALAPTQSEPPFAVAQGIVLAVFVVLGILAVKSFHPESKPGGLRMA